MQFRIQPIIIGSKKKWVNTEMIIGLLVIPDWWNWLCYSPYYINTLAKIGYTWGLPYGIEKFISNAHFRIPLEVVGHLGT